MPPDLVKLRCRLRGHDWTSSGVLMPPLAHSIKIEGNHLLCCPRCGAEILCWYGHPVPNIGIRLLRHRFKLRLHHWRV